MNWPDVPSLDLILERLPLIFPEGTPHRGYVIREMAAKTIYVMFYAGAIEGSDRWIRPSQVTDMSDAQAALTDEPSREEWVKKSLSSQKNRPGGTWYAVNSREPVRDETIRSGFIPCRAVVERQGIPTTSPKPTYALNGDLASLFAPGLSGRALTTAIGAWQRKYLNKAAIARIRLLQAGALEAKDGVSVRFPGGEIRSLKPGPSSVIAKSVIEVFAPRFLRNPAVLWFSESGNKVVARDEALAAVIGLKIDASRSLPDLILLDMGADEAGSEILLVFVEIVASDGPVTEERKVALTSLAVEAGLGGKNLAFLTAYQDRSDPSFRKSIAELAWGSYAWCASEPDHLIELHAGTARKLSDWPIR